MIFFENFFGDSDIANFLGFLFPGHSEQPIEIIAADGGFRGHGRHHFEPLQFLDGLFVRVFGHAGGFNFLAKLVNFTFFAAAQFFLNGLEFFVEVVLFLRALHLALHAGIDVAFDVKLFDFDVENFANAGQALDRIKHFEQFLLFLDRQSDVGRDGVGDTAGIVYAGGGDDSVVVDGLRKFHVLLEKLV